jgi:arylsulfatase A-like enzyme
MVGRFRTVVRNRFSANHAAFIDEPAAMADRPNILWIVTTQWRASACGYAGDPNARTPYLDALATKSENFIQAVTPHPFGPFARAALLTGLPSPENGVRDYFDPLPAGARTIAHDLRDRGYSTAWFGKWHLATRDPAAPLVGEPHARTVVPPGARGGFAFWEGFESGFLLNDPWLHGTRLPEPVPFTGYQSDVVCARAAAWLRENALSSRLPFFCVVSLEPPHPPYGAPAANVAPVDAGSLALPRNVPRGGTVDLRARRELSGYYAHITATDRAIGHLVAQLPADVVVVFTSVHGDMHGAHGLFRKGWPHEDSVRVPLLIRRHGVAPHRSDAAVSLLDLPAMTRTWADGHEWRCPRDHALISMPSTVPFAGQCDRGWRGVRTSGWKFVWNADGSPWLAFDLSSDGDEFRNLITDGDASRIETLARGRL